MNGDIRLFAKECLPLLRQMQNLRRAGWKKRDIREVFGKAATSIYSALDKNVVDMRRTIDAFAREDIRYEKDKPGRIFYGPKPVPTKKTGKPTMKGTGKQGKPQ